MNIPNFFKTACLFEAALAVVALVLASLVDVDAFAQLFFSENAIALGVLGTVPLALLFLAMQHLPQQSIRAIRELLLKTLAPSLHTRHWTELLLLACIAGFSEELLFRGVIQPWISTSGGVIAGLWLSNILFGLVHAVTPLYALIVTLVGVYLSLSMTVSGEHNLLIPIVIHSLYDFWAFIALLRLYRTTLSS